MVPLFKTFRTHVHIPSVFGYNKFGGEFSFLRQVFVVVVAKKEHIFLEVFCFLKSLLVINLSSG